MSPGERALSEGTAAFIRELETAERVAQLSRMPDEAFARLIEHATETALVEEAKRARAAEVAHAEAFMALGGEVARLRQEWQEAHQAHAALVARDIEQTAELRELRARVADVADVARLRKDNEFWHRENDALIETGTKWRARAEKAEEVLRQIAVGDTTGNADHEGHCVTWRAMARQRLIEEQLRVV